jgi:hypothetical protein
MQKTFQWGVQITPQGSKESITIGVTPDKAVAAAQAVHDGGKLVRVMVIR